MTLKGHAFGWFSPLKRTNTKTKTKKTKNKQKNKIPTTTKKKSRNNSLVEQTLLKSSEHYGWMYFRPTKFAEDGKQGLTDSKKLYSWLKRGGGY